MCNINKMLAVAEKLFENDDVVVSIGTRHLHTKYPKDADITILLGSRVEFNSYLHRRDMVDVMFFFNLYVKLLDDGRYQAGVHGSSEFVVKDKPTTAITEAAWETL